MKYTHLFSLSFLMLILGSCGSDVEENDKIDGLWNLEIVLGGIQGGGFPFDGDITIDVSGCDLDMYRDGELIMEADISYSLDEFDNVILKIDKSYVDEQPEFFLGCELISRKSEDESTLLLWQKYDDGYSYSFVK